MHNKEAKIIIAGFGGQGVVLTGNILARAGMAEDKHVTGMVSYGAEMRGGTANSTVVISDNDIASPFVVNPNIAIILNQPSLDKFEDRLLPKGLVVINTSLISRELQRDDLEVVKIAATDIANKLGNVRVANIVALGAFIEKSGLLKTESVLQAIEDLFLSKKPKLVEINKKAFQQGAENCVTA
jgi:2-oxoglutarate ferredoxin oxidoreductase subunit gamma